MGGRIESDEVEATAEEQSAVVFPGQGSQHEDMQDHTERVAPDLVDRASDLIGTNPLERLDDGTEFVQPAVFCSSVAHWRELRDDDDVDVTALAGHSLGEIAALVAAGAISKDEGLELVVLRGKLTQEVAQEAGGGMLAVMGGTIEDVGPMAERAGVYVANENSPRQIVLSGEEEQLADAASAARDNRLKAVRLDVDGPFHSPLMQRARREFRRALREIDIQRPRVPIYSGTTARPFSHIGRQLAEALVKRVRWRETVQRLHDRGIDRFVEAGPGRVLSGLVKRTVRGVETEAVDDDAPRGPATSGAAKS
jgi:malonyl CoA-acyl carrier protein transacylase